MKIFYTLFSCLLFLIFSNQLTAQCDFSCTPNNPGDVSSEQFYVAPLPNGVQNELYDFSMSFLLPDNTGDMDYFTDEALCADPAIPCGFILTEIEVLDVIGLDALGGDMEWRTDQDPDNIYNAGDAGCARICGTPTESGTYTIFVRMTACTTIGICQEADLPLEVIVEPEDNGGGGGCNSPCPDPCDELPCDNVVTGCTAATNGGFSTDCVTACPETPVTLLNNMPSNGDPNVSFFWDFGNGMTSSDENPMGITYAAEGSYYIYYRREKYSYTLEEVIIKATSCNDLLSAADFEISISNPNISDITITAPENTDPPVSLMTNLNLEVGENYELVVSELDPLGIIEDCGSINFTSATTGDIISGDLTIELVINEELTEQFSVSEVVEVSSAYCGVAINDVAAFAKNFEAYPNPAKDILGFSYQVDQPLLNAHVELTNVLGEIVLRETLSTFPGNYELSLDIQNLPNGFYFLNLYADDQVFTKKIILENY